MNPLLLLVLSLAQSDAPAETRPATSQAPADVGDAAAEVKWGHSHLGGQYDEGPRQKPWRMEGVGQVHFPITSADPEAQAWFEQGIALLHGFWPYEAERAFRWVAHLDPDCAMAYWGLAQTARMDAERKVAFLDQAVERAAGASERERAYIDLAVARQALEEASEDEELEAEVQRLSDRLVMDYPEDLEAQAFASLKLMEAGRMGEDETNRIGIEAMHQRILERAPGHVGALHYRIHNWDGIDGEYAIDSCMKLTEVAPECGHLQHMPGHVLSGIGMWHEAAIALDSATRVEQRYMNRRRVMPEDNWNYMHNLDYLAYVQGQLGMHATAVTTAQQLVVIPLHELPGGDGPGAMLGDPTRMGVLRELMRAGRWEALLDGALLQWPEQPAPGEQILRHYGEAHAHLAQGDLEAARASLGAVEQSIDTAFAMFRSLPEDKRPPAEVMEQMEPVLRMPASELEALLALAGGSKLEGIQLLTEFAEQQEEAWRNDPPMVPFYGFNLLGEALLELGSAELAAEAFERTLETVFHDGVALAGLVQAYHAAGRDEEAAAALAALEVAWSEADAGNERLIAARATGVTPATGPLPAPFTQPMTQRRYGAHVLAEQGPCLYEPAPAPRLAARDAAGDEVTLADYEGRSVLLVFYLGDQCTHCVEQLLVAEERNERFAELGVAVLAVSKDSVEKNAEVQPDFELRLLSDPDFGSARRYGSYDDFEDVELHSTVLIDPRGRIHFIETGGEPFMDFDFLEREAARLHEGGVIHGIREGALGAVLPADGRGSEAGTEVAGRSGSSTGPRERDETLAR